MKPETICVHGRGKQKELDKTGSVSMPIYQTATFVHQGVNKSTGYDYSRLQNPTREQLEYQVTQLEEGYDAIAFSTGMAAISAVMELFEPGDEIIVSDDLYGGSIRLFQQISKKNHIKVVPVDSVDCNAIAKQIGHRTKAIFVETPSNPMMKITDLRAISRLSKKHHLLMIVDNTFMTPLLQKPILLGSDIVIHSGTKYLGGHNDTLAGFAVSGNKEIADRLRFIYKTTGACLAPMDSWLIMRGLKTLAIRMKQQESNAFMIAEWLKHQEKVKNVYYIGLPEQEGHLIHKNQATGFGGMISVRVDSRETAVRILERVKLIQYAESLGGVESLITYPMLQTHADVPIEERLKKGIDDTLLRLSVGIENPEDLIEDLAQAIL